MASSYSITINGVDRTACVYNRSVTLADEEGEAPSTLGFDFFNHDVGTIPEVEEEVIVTRDGIILFAGTISKISFSRKGSKTYYSIDCQDYTRSLSRKLVVEGYENMTDKDIIEDIVSHYCQNTGITTNNVIEGVTISQISFSYMPVAQCLSQICSLTGRSWYLDYEKDIHYFTTTTTIAPFNIDDTSSDYKDLEISKDNSNIKNRVYVRGGKYESEDTVISMVADGEQVVFLVPDEAVEYAWKLEVNTGGGFVEKSLGIKNTDKADMWDYLMNIKDKYFECGSETATPTAGTIFKLTYKYYIPVLVVVSDTTSIEAIGPYEYAVFDSNILDLQQARDRAAAELADYAHTMVDGKFTTLTNGFKGGQYMHIEITDMDIDDDYLIQRVIAKSIGGGEFQYTVSIVSSKKVGIVNFLIHLLEQDKNALDIDNNETVDELFEIVPEAITIDDDADNNITLTSVTPPYKWGAFKWGLMEWS